MAERRRFSDPFPPFGLPRRPPGAAEPVPVENIWDTLIRLGGYLRPDTLKLGAVGFLVIAANLTTLLGPWLQSQAIDQGILPGNLLRLGHLVLVMVGIYTLGVAFTWLHTWLMIGISQRTIRDLRQDLFVHLQTLPLRFFDRQPHGELMSRLTNDLDTVSNTLTQSFTQLVSSGVSVVGVTLVMVLLNWRMALVTLMTIPTMALLTQWIASHTRTGFRDQQKYLGQLNGMIEETITGQRVVQAYRGQGRAIAAFEAANAALLQAALKAQIFTGLMGPTMNLIQNIGLAVVAGAGGYMALRGWASVGEIAAFVNYSRQFGRPLREMADLYNTIQAAIAGAERVFEILDEEPEKADPAGAIELDKVQGNVVFEQVSFGYVPGVPVLQDISLQAAPGQTIALVGPTGAGKTTIVNLLSRFYDLETGHIRIDGHDLGQVTRDSLRPALGIVLQDTFLFAETVRENIRYGRLDATDEEVEWAARLANADSFIHRLPQGYDTMLSETGGNLSQGQRQLLAIARAVLANPSILILDEATSSVDSRTELHLQEALLQLMRGRTSFVIAHRLSTIRQADQILVLDGGRIVERGTHAELLAHRGLYYKLFTTLFAWHPSATTPDGHYSEGGNIDAP